MVRDDAATGSAARVAVSVVRVDGMVARREEDEVACEEPLEIRLRGRAISVTMRTPGESRTGDECASGGSAGKWGSDAELAAGFLFTEGVVRAAADIELIEACGRNEHGNVVNVRLGPLVHVDFERLTRHVFASSSCGLCGKATIEAVRSGCARIGLGMAVRAEVLARMPERMREAQAAFARTGGLHAAALFSESGELMVVREDVGRHNAVDKVVGWALMKGMLPLSRAVLVVSGRSSFEIMQKAGAAGIAIVAAVSAPSSLAVQIAEEAGQTLVGFVRGARMNIYTHPERIGLQ